MQRKNRMVNNTHNKSMFVYSSIIVTAFIVMAAPIVGSIPNAFATFMPFSLEEEPTQDGEVGLPSAENNTAVTNVTSPPQTPEANLTTTPEPTEAEPQVPTPSQVPTAEQNQSEATAGRECPPSTSTVTLAIKSGNPSPSPNQNIDLLNEHRTPSGTWAKAPIVSPNTAWSTISGTQWISSGRLNSETWYRVTFTLPQNYVSPTLQYLLLQFFNPI